MNRVCTEIRGKEMEVAHKLLDVKTWKTFMNKSLLDHFMTGFSLYENGYLIIPLPSTKRDELVDLYNWWITPLCMFGLAKPIY